MEYKSSPKRPYLLRAYYDWLVDNSFTPYLVVDCDLIKCECSCRICKDGQIVKLVCQCYGNLHKFAK